MTGAWHKWRRTVLAVAALAVTGGLGACTSPPPLLYTIAPVHGAEQPGGPRIILLQQIGLARSSEDYRLDVMQNDWWGEPLGAMLSRVLVDELSQRMPQSVVISENGAVSASPDATIELSVRRLDEDASGSVILSAQAAVNFKGRQTPALRSFRFSVMPQTAGVPGEVAAISAALGQLADGLAAMLVAGPTAQ